MAIENYYLKLKEAVFRRDTTKNEIAAKMNHTALSLSDTFVLASLMEESKGRCLFCFL